jgi:hypothetical protein
VFRDMNLARIFPLSRHLLAVAAIVTLLVPAYSQQEVAPTWYDPWKAASNTVVYRPQQTRIAHRENRTRISSGAEVRKNKTEQIEHAARERKRPRQIAAAK